MQILKATSLQILQKKFTINIYLVICSYCKQGLINCSVNVCIITMEISLGLIHHL